MTEKHIFDDLDALRSAGAAQKNPRKSERMKGTARAKNGRYVQMTEQEASAGFLALGSPASIVWFEILYLTWKKKCRTVVVPNKELAQMGVSRWTKKRALIRLAQAGLIRAVQIGKKSPRVTVLKR